MQQIVLQTFAGYEKAREKKLNYNFFEKGSHAHITANHFPGRKIEVRFEVCMYIGMYVGIYNNAPVFHKQNLQTMF
jgi:hypothetical protein